MGSNGAKRVAEQASFTVRPGRLDDIPELMVLFTEMDYSRLHELGPRFVRVLHRHIILSQHAVCQVAEFEGRIVGYITGASDTERFSRDFKLRYGVLAGLLLLPNVFRPRQLKTIYRCLTYSSEAEFGDKASGLTFAVRKGAKQQGIGTALWQALMREFRKRGIVTFTFATAGDPTAAANAFYKRLGCEFLGTQRFYEDSVTSVYRYRLQ